NIWYENDDFWETMAPKIFSKDHWERATKEVDKIISLLEISPKAYILDLCCGPGRHSLEFARRGFKVLGIDRTLKYLEKARKQAKTEGLNVEFLQEDMRNFCKPNTFDVVLNLFTSFGYFENQKDDEKVLKNIYLSLKTGGKLLLDLVGKEVLAPIFTERSWAEEDGILFLMDSKPIEGWSKIKNRWIMIKDDIRKEFTFTHRIYSGSEISNLLYKSGFKSVELIGDLNGNPYDNTAKRLITIAIK
ncbi:MAG: class I SAM-dependent methyltransferase, partial [Candidatus Hodarchaeota archaeon]